MLTSRFYNEVIQRIPKFVCLASSQRTDVSMYNYCRKDALDLWAHDKVDIVLHNVAVAARCIVAHNSHEIVAGAGHYLELRLPAPAGEEGLEERCVNWLVIHTERVVALEGKLRLVLLAVACRDVRRNGPCCAGGT